MIISNITLNIKINECYKHKGTKSTKLYLFSLCTSCLCVYYFSLGAILLISTSAKLVYTIEF